MLNIVGIKAHLLDPLIGTIPDAQLVIVPDPTTGKLLRTTIGQIKADIVLEIGAISYLDQIIEVDQIANLPNPGVIKTIYVITGAGPDQNKQLRWGGSLYIEFPAGSGDVAAEAIIRGNADAVLQANITAEATARSNADTALQANITAEATARSNADTALLQNINAEKNTRSTNDNILQGAINTEGTVRAQADFALHQRIDDLEFGGGGSGLPVGGTIGQVLTKQSGTNYDAIWQDAAAGGAGGGIEIASTYAGIAGTGKRFILVLADEQNNNDASLYIHTGSTLRFIITLP